MNERDGFFQDLIEYQSQVASGNLPDVGIGWEFGRIVFRYWAMEIPELAHARNWADDIGPSSWHKLQLDIETGDPFDKKHGASVAEYAAYHASFVLFEVGSFGATKNKSLRALVHMARKLIDYAGLVASYAGNNDHRADYAAERWVCAAMRATIQNAKRRASGE